MVAATGIGDFSDVSSDVASAINLAIERDDEAGLATIVCAATVEEIRRIALLAPNLIVAEPTDLIGTGVVSDMGYIRDTIEVLRKINPENNGSSRRRNLRSR